ERAEQREVQARAHGVGSESACQGDIGFELRPIAVHFLLEKCLEATAFVPARLEVDHPTRAVTVNERSVDHYACQPTGRDACQSQLAACLAVFGSENPSSSLIFHGPRQGLHDYIRGARKVALRHAVSK